MCIIKHLLAVLNLKLEIMKNIGYLLKLEFDFDDMFLLSSIFDLDDLYVNLKIIF